MRPMILAARIAALLGVLALPAVAGAQAPGPARTSVTVPLQDLASADGLGERLGRLWAELLDTIGVGLGPASLMRNHSAAVQRQAELRDDFAWLMDIAGYKLTGIDSAIGVIPGLGLAFGQARELTEADRDYVERQLARHAGSHGGPLAALQRTIVRTVLEASEIGNFAVERLEVELLPLPRVRFALAPADAPLGSEAARIMRAIERLNTRLQTMPPHQQGFDLMPPGSPSPLRPAALRREALSH